MNGNNQRKINVENTGNRGSLPHEVGLAARKSQLHVGYLGIKSSLVLRLSVLGVGLEMPCVTITIQGPSPRHWTLCCPDQELFFMASMVHALGSNFLSAAQTSFSKKLAHESLPISTETPLTNVGLIQHL